jgi:hypothetical protein
LLLLAFRYHAFNAKAGRHQPLSRLPVPDE